MSILLNDVGMGDLRIVKESDYRQGGGGGAGEFNVDINFTNTGN
jgi:hypothetical protein